MADPEEEENPRDGPGLIDLDMASFGSGSMSDPLRHAVGLRTAQDKCKMRMWESFPSLFQNTIFHGEQDPEIKALRHSGSLAERLARARELKDKGNAALKAVGSTSPPAAAAPEPELGQRRLRDAEERELRLQAAIAEKERELKGLRHELKLLRAEREQQLQPQGGGPGAAQAAGDSQGWQEGLEAAITSYEKAAGLLRYVECVRPDWRNDDGSYKGIEDAHLRVDAAALEGDCPEAAEARELVTSCYLNIALASQKLGKFDQMRSACDEVLGKVNKDSVKALYRRAQARAAPAGALDADRAAAVQDLLAAAQLAPQDRDVRVLLASLRAEKKAKEASERSAFAGMFERGEVVTEEPRVDAPPPEKLDLRDPKVQRMLDIYPGPDHFQD